MIDDAHGAEMPHAARPRGPESAGPRQALIRAMSCVVRGAWCEPLALPATQYDFQLSVHVLTMGRSVPMVAVACVTLQLSYW